MPNDSDLIDERKIATNLASKAIDRVIATADGALRTFWSRQRNKDVQFFANYLVRMRSYCRTVKNLATAGEDLDLVDIYVDQHVRDYDQRVLGSSFLRSMSSPTEADYRREYRASVVEAPAGAGKSIFLRHSFLTLSNEEFSKIPLFVEMRNLKRQPGHSLEDLICQFTKGFEPRLMREQIIEGLKSGLYFLLFDGFDEIPSGSREYYEREMSRLSIKYPKVPIIVSGRPHNSFTAWPMFGTCSIVPLTLEEATQLLLKLNYNEEIKTEFLKLLSSKLFKSHYDFASLPLLLIIMLITFAHAGTVSSKRHEFYEDAFEALWSKHDLKSKSGWVRPRETELSKSRFSELLSAFCFSAYLDEDYDFDSGTLSRHLKHANELSGLQISTDDFIADMQGSLSLFLQDGRNHRFIHRTFQEYYVAQFITGLDDGSMAEILASIQDRAFVDNVLDLAFSMDRRRVESNFVLPIVEKYASLLGKKIVPIKNYLEIYAADDIDILRLLYGFRYSLIDIEEALASKKSVAESLRVNFGGSIQTALHDLLSEDEVGDPIFEDRKKIALVVNQVTENCQRSMSGVRNFLRSRLASDPQT